MRLWIVSDLHLEATRGWELPAGQNRPDFDVMVVAGDLIPGMHRGVKWLAQNVPDRPVIYVPGNHEFYGEDIDRTVVKAREAAQGTNVHVLQNDAITVDGVCFIGATLWTDFNLFGNPREAMRGAHDVMNDYRKIRKGQYIRKLTPVDTLLRHNESCAFIKKELSGTTKHRRVVVSHHAPLRACISGRGSDLINAAYASDLQTLVRGADLWIHGHTHDTRDFKVDHTRVVTNAKGYGPWPPRELTLDNETFDPALTVQI